MAAVDAGLAVSDIRALDRLPRPEVERRQLQARLVSGFGLIALLLAATGVYAVVTLSMTQRRKELAIRVALGAEARHVRRLVWREALMPVILGVGPGLAAAVALGMFLRGALFQVSPLEPSVLILTPLILVLAAMVPAHMVSRRAERVATAAVIQSE